MVLSCFHVRVLMMIMWLSDQVNSVYPFGENDAPKIPWSPPGSCMTTPVLVSVTVFPSELNRKCPWVRMRGVGVFGGVGFDHCRNLPVPAFHNNALSSSELRTKTFPSAVKYPSAEPLLGMSDATTVSPASNRALARIERVFWRFLFVFRSARR